MIRIPSLQQPVEAKTIMRKRVLTDITVLRQPLPLILAFQALLSWFLLQNTAFQDEALYVYAGRQIWQAWLGGPPILENYSYFFSGCPYVYPIIGGALDLLGGLELVRFFSLICMLIVTTCGYYVTKQFFDQKSAVFAALFFVCQGPVLFLSRMATYDSLCFCLVAVGTALAVNASQAQRPWRALIISPFLVLACCAKYAGLFFIPSVFAILALCTTLKWGWISMLVRGALGTLSLAVVGTLAVLAMLHFDPDIVHAINATTTNRMVLGVYSHLGLAEHVIQMAGLSYAIGFVGLIFARKKNLLIAPLFLCSALLVPAYHIYKAEMISLDKHLGFSMFFVMPVAGYTLASLSGFRGIPSPGRHWLSGVAICLILAHVGIGEAQSLYSQWPSTTGLAYAFQTQARPASGHYLVEQYEVLRYYSKEDTYSWQWVGTYFFQYTDKQGRYYLDDDAYVKAINDGYFDLIELNYGASVQRDILIAQAIKQSKKYVLIDKIPYWSFYGPGYFWVWRKI